MNRLTAGTGKCLCRFDRDRHRDRIRDRVVDRREFGQLLQLFRTRIALDPELGSNLLEASPDIIGDPQPTILFGNTSLHVGMDEPSVLSSLRESYILDKAKVSDQPDTSAWIVKE